VRRRTLSDAVTAPYPCTGIPTWVDDDTTVRIDAREMSFTAEAAMFIDTALIGRA